MRLFAKWFWGFRPEEEPFIGFSEEIYRNKLLQTAKSGDRIVYVVSQNENSLDHEKSKILGMTEITDLAIKSIDTFEDASVIPKAHFKNGQYKWPYGVLVKKAWRFDEPFEWAEVMGDNWRGNFLKAMNEVVLLNDDEQEAILKRPHTAVTLKESQKIKARLGDDEALKSFRKEDHDWQTYISQTTKNILARVKTNNGQEVRKVVKNKTTDMNEGQLQLEIKKLLIKNGKFCSITKQPLILGDKWLKPSLDRIDSDKGYIRGNLQLTSWAANMAKSDISPEEVEAYFSALQNYGK